MQRIMFIYAIIGMALVTALLPVPWTGFKIKRWQWHILSTNRTCDGFLIYDNSVIINIIHADNLCQ